MQCGNASSPLNAKYVNNRTLDKKIVYANQHLSYSLSLTSNTSHHIFEQTMSSLTGEKLIVEHIVAVRKRVCPRTSYATSGAAGSVLCAYVAKSQEDMFRPLLSALQHCGEFEKVIAVHTLSELCSVVNGNVVLFCEELQEESLRVIETIFSGAKTKLVVSLAVGDAKSSATNASQRFSVLDHTSGSCHIQSLYNYRPPQGAGSASKAPGFNGQPSVQSGLQFRYLWSPSTPQIENGKDRVLQRLADRTLFGSNAKLSTQQWDLLVQQTLASGQNDYGVYNMIREKVLGTSLAHDLQINLNDDTAEQAKKAAPEETAEEGDGRANHMVSRTLESVPLRLRQGSQQGRGTGVVLNRMLDYGCAEGAITAALGKQLGLSPAHILGADVRSIPSLGFTFLPLAAEEDATPPGLRTILPTIEDGSVDLITSAMVFHHVTHVKAVLLELRRVISSQGALVIREHHCVSADMGAFLDITHGLYSLSWSQPVEWPDFIAEYKAFYRSREEWDALARECGFILSLEECGPQAMSNYRAAEFAKRKSHGFFPNVIKAYYATYKPDPRFKLPTAPPVAAVASGGSANEGSKKRALVFADDAAAGVAQKKANIGSTSTDAANSVLSAQSAQSDNKLNKTEENEVFESKKYPGKFYRINKTTGATEWV